MNEHSITRQRGAGQAANKTSSTSETSESPEFHSLAAIDPLMDGAAYAALVEDIRLHDLRQPIIIYQGKILDGRNRSRACGEAGVEPEYHEIAFTSDAEAIAYLDSANLHRRHLTPEQKRDRVAARLKADPTLSDRQVAEQTGTSHPTVGKVRGELEDAGDVERVSTSVDTKGREQPRQRSKAALSPFAKYLLQSRQGRGFPAPEAGQTDNTDTPAPTDSDGATPAASMAAKPAGAACEPAAETPASSRDAGPYSGAEHDRLRARNDALNEENRALQIRISGLESEIAELKARVVELEAAATTGAPIQTPAIDAEPEVKPALVETVPAKAARSTLIHIADLARNCRGLLAHHAQNVAGIREKLSQIIKLSDPDSNGAAKTNAKLDQKLFRRAMALEGGNEAPARSTGNDVDTEQSAEERRAFYAAAEATADPKKDGIPIFLQTQNTGDVA